MDTSLLICMLNAFKSANTLIDYRNAYENLLVHFFREDDFRVGPYGCDGPTGPTEMITLDFKDDTVLFLNLNPTKYFDYATEQSEADFRMHQWFTNFRGSSKTPVMRGISVFGTRMAFYECNDNIVTPPMFGPDEIPTTDRWNYDILDPSAVEGVRQVAREVRAACPDLRKLYFGDAVNESWNPLITFDPIYSDAP